MATLPSNVKYGKVVARILLAVGDTAADPDRFPDGKPPVGGRVVFTPVQTNILEVAEPTTLIIKQPVYGPLNSEGYMVDETPADGVWLVTGQYKVTANNIPGFPKEFTIQVTEAHTDAAPLDLLSVLPPTGTPAPVPQWQLLTLGQYNALAADGGLEAGTVYLISREGIGQ